MFCWNIFEQNSFISLYDFNVNSIFWTKWRLPFKNHLINNNWLWLKTLQFELWTHLAFSLSHFPSFDSSFCVKASTLRRFSLASSRTTCVSDLRDAIFCVRLSISTRVWSHDLQIFSISETISPNFCWFFTTAFKKYEKSF